MPTPGPRETLDEIVLGVLLQNPDLPLSDLIDGILIEVEGMPEFKQLTEEQLGAALVRANTTVIAMDLGLGDASGPRTLD